MRATACLRFGRVPVFLLDISCQYRSAACYLEEKELLRRTKMSMAGAGSASMAIHKPQLRL
jgi:hypothetical protein